MKRFLTRIGLFIVFSLLVFQILGYVFDAYFNRFDNHYLKDKSSWILKWKAHHFDFAILGSSRAHNVLDVLTMEKSCNKKGVSLAMPGSSLAANYLILKEFLETGNTTDRLLLSVDYFAFNSGHRFSYPFPDYAFLPLFNKSYVSEIYYDEIPGYQYYLWKIAPLLKYTEFSTKYPFYDNLRKMGQPYENRYLDSTKGSVLLSSEHYSNTMRGKKPERYYLSPDPIDWKYFEKIVVLCQAENINLILFDSPYYEEIYAYRNYDEISDTLGLIARDRSLPYYACGRDSVGKHKALFKDATHLNRQGAMHFSRRFAEQLKHDGLL